MSTSQQSSLNISGVHAIGSPRIWAEPDLRDPVLPDSGLRYIDQNGHRMNGLTLLPLIRAVQDMTDQGLKPAFDWKSVDFVTARSPLRMLLSWTVGKSDSWRIDTQLAGQTVLFSGRAPVTRTWIGGPPSYGFNFETKSTSSVPGLENETGHYRIITYVSHSTQFQPQQS